MFSDKLMDKLAEVLREIVSENQTPYNEKVRFIMEAMKAKGCELELEEFCAWFEG